MKHFLKRATLSARSRGQKGFTLIELLICLVIIAILIALISRLIPHALNKAKVVRTQAYVRDAGQAWCVGVGGTYSQIGPGVLQPSPVDPAADFPVTFDATQIDSLEQFLGVTLPRYDAWSQPLEYLADINMPLSPVDPLIDPIPTRLMVRSLNVNQSVDSPYAWKTIFPFSEKDEDLVWVNCDWVQVIN